MAGRRLRATREALGLRQEALASELGIGRTTLANWEGGKLPDVRAMVRLLAERHIPLEWIYAGLLRGVPHALARALEHRAAELCTEAETFPINQQSQQTRQDVASKKTQRELGGAGIRRGQTA